MTDVSSSASRNKALRFLGRYPRDPCEAKTASQVTISATMPGLTQVTWSERQRHKLEASVFNENQPIYLRIIVLATQGEGLTCCSCHLCSMHVTCNCPGLHLYLRRLLGGRRVVAPRSWILFRACLRDVFGSARATDRTLSVLTIIRVQDVAYRVYLMEFLSSVFFNPTVRRQQLRNFKRIPGDHNFCVAFNTLLAQSLMMLRRNEYSYTHTYICTFIHSHIHIYIYTCTCVCMYVS